MRLLRAFGRFWYDFLIGDDWKIAASVVTALALLAVLVRLDAFDERTLAVLGGILLMAAFTASLLLDIRHAKARRNP